MLIIGCFRWGVCKIDEAVRAVVDIHVYKRCIKSILVIEEERAMLVNLGMSCMGIYDRTVIKNRSPPSRFNELSPFGPFRDQLFVTVFRKTRNMRSIG